MVTMSYWWSSAKHWGTNLLLFGRVTRQGVSTRAISLAELLSGTHYNWVMFNLLDHQYDVLPWELALYPSCLLGGGRLHGN